MDILNDSLTDEQLIYAEDKIQEKVISMKPLLGGATNKTYEVLSDSGKKYTLRIPGKDTNQYIDRYNEMYNISKAGKLGIIPKVICADSQTGVLIMEYVENSTPCSVEKLHQRKTLQYICNALFTLHTSGIKFENEFNISTMRDMYRKYLLEIGGKIPDALLKVEHQMDEWVKYLYKNYPKELVSCHIDPKLNNFLQKGDKIYFIDWEYSGMADLYFELANFVLTNNLASNDEKIFIEVYCKTSGIDFIREKYLLYKMATDYLWVYWHLIKLQQNYMVKYNEMGWQKRLRRAEKVLTLIEDESEIK